MTLFIEETNCVTRTTTSMISWPLRTVVSISLIARSSSQGGVHVAHPPALASRLLSGYQRCERASSLCNDGSDASTEMTVARIGGTTSRGNGVSLECTDRSSVAIWVVFARNCREMMMACLPREPVEGKGGRPVSPQPFGNAGSWRGCPAVALLGLICSRFRQCTQCGSDARVWTNSPRPRPGGRRATRPTARLRSQKRMEQQAHFPFVTSVRSSSLEYPCGPTR